MNNLNLINYNSIITNQKDMNYIQQNNVFSPQHLEDLSNNNSNIENIIQINSLFPEEKSEVHELSDDNEEINKKQIKRRSKKEVEGRNYVCKLCSKSYLSYSALYNHYKQKHKTNNSSVRGRGRPKKLMIDNDEEKFQYNPQNSSFFSKKERTGKTDPKNEINNCIKEAFNDLYNLEKKNRIDERNIKFYNSLDEHPFLSKFKNDLHEINKLSGDEHQLADIVLIEYLNKMSTFCNPKYYVKLIKFVTLFREHVNMINLNKNKDNINGKNKDYTEYNDAEDIPNSSNEFISDFLDPEGKNDDLGYTKEECIELTQNLCYWMYDNNFTCSKLSLINEEN